MSLFWRQTAPVLASHLPFVQTFEQHWAAVAAVQLLPVPVHAPPLIARHVGPAPAAPHLPLQHCLLALHATASLTQALAEQILSAPQLPEQQSELFVHCVAEAFAMHGPVRLPHMFGE